MIVYVAMDLDRHYDPTPVVFSTPEAAVAWARTEVHDRAQRPDDVEEYEIAGHLYSGCYSSEGDSIFVIEKEVRE